MKQKIKDFRTESKILGPLILIVIDGYGITWRRRGNAIKLANKPTLDMLDKSHPRAILKAAGNSVGLPNHQMGSSEVGHTNIGAGRIIKQDLLLIDKEIKEKTFFENTVLKEVFSKNEYVHLVGLVSDGGVHSHQEHLYALIEMAKQCNSKIYVHAILDGRDSHPKSALSYIKKLEKKLKGIGQIVTVSGRFYTMDRDKRWERTKRAYDTMVDASTFYHKNAIEAIKSAYEKKTN